MMRVVWTDARGMHEVSVDDAIRVARSMDDYAYDEDALAAFVAEHAADIVGTVDEDTQP